VSHDQAFLNSTCTDILELRTTLGGQKKSALTHFSGDYITYQETLAEKKVAVRRELAALEIQKEKLREFVSRDGKKYDGPAHQAQRKSKLKKLEELNKLDIEDIEDDAESTLIIPSPNGVYDPAERLISIESASFAWPGDPPVVLFEGVEMCVSPGSRIGILGTQIRHHLIIFIII
jgi:ATPase subunit of ABC transporter with duplicated ATPase domains